MFFNSSKCKCGSSNISNVAVFPTVPIVCPCLTFSSSLTNSAVSRLEYTLVNPFSCSITTVIPYLGSFFIDFIVPSADAFTIVVFSALISIAVCVIHSFNVSE